MEPTKKDLLLLENKYRPSHIEELFKKSGNRDSESGPKTTSVAKSEMFGRVKDFLHVMEEANRTLYEDIEKKGTNDHMIDELTGEEDRYVEMDLALGVAELNTTEALAAAEAAVAGQKPAALNVSSESDDSDSDSEDESSKCIVKDEVQGIGSKSVGNSVDKVSKHGDEGHDFLDKKGSGKRKRVFKTQKPKRPKIEML